MRRSYYRMFTMFLVVFILSISFLQSGGGSPGTQRAQAATCGATTNFITTWKTDNPGTSSATSITVPAAGTNNYSVDWNNDGIMDQTGITGSVTHDFGAPGTYTIQICGTFQRIYFNLTGDRQKILKVDQWGNNAWTSMLNSFYGCSNLDVTATDVPNLSGVTNMGSMFRGAASLVGTSAFSAWNTSSVTVMGSVFQGATAFNQPIGSWNTSAATSMNDMFNTATVFNQPIGSWDTSRVTNMRSMFMNAEAFNQPIGDWDISAVPNLVGIFHNAKAFNQPIDSWDMSSVTSLERVFAQASSFNQPIGSWDTSRVTKMNSTFLNASAFNQPINNWDTSQVTTMHRMFDGVQAQVDPLNTSTVTLRPLAMAFNQDVASWDTSRVTTMLGMFANSPTEMAAYYQSLGTYTTVVPEENPAARHAFAQSLATWDMSAVTSVLGMLGRTSLSTANYDATLTAWAQQTLQPNLVLGATSLDYCESRTARQYIIDTYGWTILGDSYDCLPDIPPPSVPIAPIGAPETGSAGMTPSAGWLSVAVLVLFVAAVLVCEVAIAASRRRS